jgi:hypothetical protein
MRTKIYNESSQTLLNLVMNLKEGKLSNPIIVSEPIKHKRVIGRKSWEKNTNFGKNKITKF